jgi:hypothetical protein
MVIQPLNIDKSNTYVVTWVSKFQRTGVAPGYHADVVLVPCHDLIGARAGHWRPTRYAVKHAIVRTVPVDLLAQIELGSMWFRGIYGGLMPLEKRTFKLDPAAHPATLMLANEKNDGKYTIPEFVYAIGAHGLDTPLTRIAASSNEDLLLHPLTALQAFYGGSSPMWKLLASGVVDHDSMGAFNSGKTLQEGTLLNLDLNCDLSRRDDWVRAASFYLFPHYKRAAANLFLNCGTHVGKKLPKYIWVDIPALPELSITVRGVPLPTDEGVNPFLGLIVDKVSYRLPCDQVVVVGQGTPKIKESTGVVTTGLPRKTRRARFLREEMEIESPGGLKSTKVSTAPRLHRVELLVGAERVPDLNLPEKEVFSVPDSEVPPSQPPVDPQVPVAIAGPGIRDDLNGKPDARIAGDSTNSAPSSRDRKADCKGLAGVISALEATSEVLGAQLGFLALDGGTRFRLGDGIIGEFPTDIEKGPVTRFAWVEFKPDKPRRVLVAELIYNDRHYYVLDCEASSNQVAIGFLYQRGTYAPLAATDVRDLLLAAMCTRGVWEALNGPEYRVRKLLHFPKDSVASRLERLIRKADAVPATPPTPPDKPAGLLGLRVPRVDRPTSGSPRGPAIPGAERRKEPRRPPRNS